MRKISTIIISTTLAIFTTVPLIASGADRPKLISSGFLKLDMNYDGIIDAVDASMILSEYARLSVDQPYTFNATQRFLADFNGDYKVSAVDASAALKAYAYNSSHTEKYEQRAVYFTVVYKDKKGTKLLSNDLHTYEECMTLIEEDKMFNDTWGEGESYAINVTMTSKAGMRSLQGIYVEYTPQMHKENYLFDFLQ